jgi:hypothetical protein
MACEGQEADGLNAMVGSRNQVSERDELSPLSFSDRFMK